MTSRRAFTAGRAEKGRVHAKQKIGEGTKLQACECQVTDLEHIPRSSNLLGPATNISCETSISHRFFRESYTTNETCMARISISGISMEVANHAPVLCPLLSSVAEVHTITISPMMLVSVVNQMLAFIERPMFRRRQ